MATPFMALPRRRAHPNYLPDAGTTRIESWLVDTDLIQFAAIYTEFQTSQVQDRLQIDGLARSPFVNLRFRKPMLNSPSDGRITGKSSSTEIVAYIRMLRRTCGDSGNLSDSMIAQSVNAHLKPKSNLTSISPQRLGR
jgi:hypothetical protein